MRNQLVPFEGEQVVYEGHLSEWRKRDDEHHICFMNLSVNQFNSNKPLRDGLTTCIDHLWMTFDDEFIKNAPKDLYTKRSGLGQVYWYTRGDGSLDLSLKPVGAICLDQYFTLIDEYHHTNYDSHRIKILLDKLSKLFYQYDVENVNCYSTIMVSHPIHEVMEMLNGDAVETAAERLGIKTTKVADIFELMLGKQYTKYKKSIDVLEFIREVEPMQGQRTPMSENPDLFKSYIHPILDEIMEKF